MKTEDSMNIPYLDEFAVLGASLNYSEAAAELNISQSTLSRHIQAIEKTLGKPLFTRTTRRVSLSAFGEYLLPYASHSSASDDEITAAVERWNEEENAVLEIGCSLYSHLYEMTENVIAFRRKYPNIHIRPVERSLEELKKEYEKGRFNLITTAYPTGQKVPENMVINGSGRIIAAIPGNDPLANGAFVRITDLKERPLLIPPEKNAFNRMFRKACSEAGFTPQAVSESRYESNLQLLKEGMGIIIDTRRIALQHIDPDVVILELEPRLEFCYGLMYRDKLSRNEDLFVRFVKGRYGY